MNIFAKFDENPAMTLRVIKEKKRYGRMDGQRENSIPTTNKVCGGYNDAMEQVESQGYMLYRTTTLHGQQYEQLVVHEIVKDTRTLVKECVTKILFSYFSTKLYVMGTQQNRLNEMVLLSTQNIF